MTEHAEERPAHWVEEFDEGSQQHEYFFRLYRDSREIGSMRCFEGKHLDEPALHIAYLHIEEKERSAGLMRKTLKEIQKIARRTSAEGVYWFAKDAMQNISRKLIDAEVAVDRGGITFIPINKFNERIIITMLRREKAVN